MKFSAVLLFLLSLTVSVQSQPSQADINKVINEVNSLRKKGCRCGGKRMYPVRPISWDDDLYHVSREYARYMFNNQHFSHFSKKGEDLGDRLDRLGYNWKKIGENIGYGYNDFFGVFEAWKRSPSHCEMLMDPDVTQMGLSKYYTYWVQSFSKPFNDYHLRYSED